MTDPTPESAQFEAVLDELRVLVSGFQMIGVSVVLVGGQVLSLEARAAGGDGVIEVRTPTDLVVQRGYSMEPDLLFDIDEAAARADAVLDVLKDRGFKRVMTHRWRKETATGEVLVDLFMSSDADEANNPAGFTRLPAGDLALARSRSLRINVSSGILDIAVPDPVGFIAMKLEAKLRLRPAATKDSFDLYAYVAVKGADVVRRALEAEKRDGPRLTRELALLFGDVDSQGVEDVLSYAGTLADDERALRRYGAGAGAGGEGASMSTNSTRRFFSRPSAVSLVAIGFASPRPTASSRSAGTPRWMSALRTLSVRACDKRWLVTSEPTESVCPSMRTRPISGFSLMTFAISSINAIDCCLMVAFAKSK